MMKWVLAIVFMSCGSAAFAAPQTMVMSISGMHCGADPHIVRKALADLPGVADVQILLDDGKAIVSFDNAKVTVEQMLTASGAAGYPAHVGK